MQLKNQKTFLKLFFLTLVFGLGVFVFSAKAQAATYYVATNGLDTNGGTIGAPFKTIQKCADVVIAGDTCVVRAGTYDSFKINEKSGALNSYITFRPYLNETVIIDRAVNGYSGGTDNYAVQLYGSTNYIEIKEFEITDSGNIEANPTAWQNAALIQLTWKAATPSNIGPTYIKLTDNIIHHSGATCILDFPVSHHNEIINNLIYDCGLSKKGYWMYITGDNHIIRGNTIHDGYGIGIQLDYDDNPNVFSPDNNLIENNLIYSNGHSDYGKGYWDNDCQCVLPGKDRGYGIYVSGGGLGNVIKNNVIYDNLTWGIRVSGGTNTKIYNNTVYASGYQGINTKDSVGTTVKNNIFYGSLMRGGYAGDAEFSGSGGTQSNNLIGIVPDFINTTGHNFKLNSYSKAIDAGIVLPEVSTDFDGITRPTGAGPDIGAYEYIPPVNQNIIYVDNTPTNCADGAMNYNPATKSCGSGSYKMFKTIQKAADVVQTGDTVIIKDGTYTNTVACGSSPVLQCGVNISASGTAGDKGFDQYGNRNYDSAKWITFKAEHAGGAILDGQVNGTNNGTRGAFYVTRDYIYIEGFEMKNWVFDGVTIALNADNIRIKNNHIHDIGRICTTQSNGHDGISDSKTNSYITVDSNRIHDIGRKSKSECGTTEDRSSLDHGYYVEGSTNITLINNVFYNEFSGFAIQVQASTNSECDTAVNKVRIINNTFVGHSRWDKWGAGLHGNVQVCAANSTGYLVENNLFYDTNGNYGINFGTWASGTLKNNITDKIAVDGGGNTHLIKSGNIPNANYAGAFLDAINNNYRLTSMASAINKGIADNAPGEDYFGMLRDNQPDIGAYEYQSATTDTTAPAIPSGVSVQ